MGKKIQYNKDAKKKKTTPESCFFLQQQVIR